MGETHPGNKKTSKILIWAILGFALVVVVTRVYWAQELLVLLLLFATAFALLTAIAGLGYLFFQGGQVLLKWLRARIYARTSTTHALEGKPSKG